MFKKWSLFAAVAVGVVGVSEVAFAEPTQQIAQSNIQPFTGQIKGNRVRMRLHADRDSAIIDELERGQLVGVVGEEDEFFEVLPPKGTRAYVFRTYVLDNRIEGNRVNVRLQPSLDAPVIAQLNDGDRVEGEVSSLNSKWFEISPPSTTRFYIAKEFIEHAGNADHLSHVEKRQDEATHLVNSAYATAQAELHKPYQEIQLEPMIAQLQHVIDDYTDVPSEVSRANHYLTSLKDSYLQKKIQHLEAKANEASECFQSHCDEFAQCVKAQQNVLEALEQGRPVAEPGEEEEVVIIQELLPEEEHQPHDIVDIEPRMRGDANSWLARETMAYEAWREGNPQGSLDDFYQEQASDALHRRGVIQPYLRPVPKKPGNFMLIDPHDHRPVAFLYSTKVDLQQHVGEVRTLTLIPRPNNNFAFPAYFVLSVD